MRIGRSLILFGMIGLAGAARGAWLADVPVTLRQPDGREIQCYITGDEHFNWVHDHLKYPILKESCDGYYVYGRRAGDTLVPTTLRVGSADPVREGLIPGAPADPLKLAQTRNKYWAAPVLATRIAAQTAPKSGTIENLVIFIRFSSDPEFTDPISTYLTSFNSTIPGVNSVYNYFREISYQQLLVNSSFYPLPGSTVVSYQDGHPRGYYKPLTDDPLGYANETERTSREQTLLRNALEAVKGQVPAGLNLDGDGDGLIDNMVFIVYGTPTAWNTLLWPHAWALFQYAVTINGKRAYSYSFQIQSFVSNGSTHVMVHEMLHTVGFPDLYHYSYDGLNPVGVWDVMASPTAPPQHPGAYCKHKYGRWISQLPEVSGNGTYTLQPLTQSTGNCYKIPSPAAPGGEQFYVVEYRRRTGSLFEAALPGDGMLVYRIDNRDPGHDGDGSLPDEVYVYRPDGTLSVNGSLWSAQFSAESGRTLFNDATNPAPFLADGSAGHLDLFGVGSAGSTISFSLALEIPDPPEQVSPPDYQTDVPLSVIFTWLQAPGALSYHLQMADDSAFANLLLDQAGITLLLWPANNLAANTTYYWRVSAASTDGEGAWSDTWRFTTQPAEMPVELLSFTAAAAAEGIILEWATASETENFGFEIERRVTRAGTGVEWDKIGFIEGHGNSSSRQNYRYLDPVSEAGLYGYRLKQIDFDGTVSYHPAREVDWAHPRRFSLGQNYPNPFNPATTIGYVLQEQGEVSLVIYNSRGQLVRRLVETTQEPGACSVRWDGCDETGQPVAGGIYYYALRCKDQFERRSMLLLR
jgi:M6 family metalloprotease-like protein